MKIPNQITKESILDVTREQVLRIEGKHGKHCSIAETVGLLTEEMTELVEAVRLAKGKVSTLVFSELIDVAVVALRGCELYKNNVHHNKTKVTVNGNI